MAAYGTMANCSAALSATYSVTETPGVGFSNATISESDTSQTLFTAGTSGAGKIDQHYESGTIVTPLSIPGTPGTTITLSNIATADGVGRTVSFAHVTGFWIRLTEASPTGNLTLAPGASNGLDTLLTGTTPAIIIKRFFMWVDDRGGIAAAPGSHDTITLMASTATAIKILLGITGTYA